MEAKDPAAETLYIRVDEAKEARDEEMVHALATDTFMALKTKFNQDYPK